MAKLNSSEWYFFSFRDRKYATGYRTNRATISGYWKATGKDRTVVDTRTGAIVGMRKTLVFYKNRAPNGIKTGWIMHEFRLENPNIPPKVRIKSIIEIPHRELNILMKNIMHENSFFKFWLTKFLFVLVEFNQQEDWVLCRVFYKAKGDNSNERSPQDMYHNTCDATSLNHDDACPTLPPPPCVHHHHHICTTTPNLSNQNPTPPVHHHRHHKNYLDISPQQYNLPNLLQLSQEATLKECMDQMIVSSNSKCEDHYGFFYDMALEDYAPSQNLQDMEFDDDDNDNGIVF